MNEKQKNIVPAPTPASRCDMHCHSSASERSRLGVQRAVGLPECATPPQEVYELAKRRGMQFVTITDHDTIAGVLQIADRPDVFVSEELTAHFRGEPQAVHVLCYGIDSDEHDWLQAHNGDVEACAAYLREHEIACALAHPYYNVGAPLTRQHRRRLAELFEIWEVRNGARAPELNRPAATYVATLDGIGIGGSDDHAGVDIGRTYTQTPSAQTPHEFLALVRGGRTIAQGAQGSAAKWAHAAIAIAIRSLEGAGQAHAAPDPARVMKMVERVLREGDLREGSATGELGPEDARSLLAAWLRAVDLGELTGAELIALMQSDDFSHSALWRRACRAHERGLREAVEVALAAARGDEQIVVAAERVFGACIAAIPYAPATAFLASEQTKLAALPGPGPSGSYTPREDGELPRVAILADGIGSTHGVTRTIEEIRQRGVPGFEIEVLATDPRVDRRLSAVADVEVPFYPGLRIGVPSLPTAVQALTEGSFDAVHVCSPGPTGVAGVLVARALGLPLLGSYHTELTAYAGLRSQDPRVAAMMAAAVEAFYRACDLVLSPSPASDGAMRAIGIARERIMRWDRGVDTARFDPALRDETLLPGALTVLYSGRISSEKGVELLADAFLAARARDERLHLVLAGGGPEQELLRARLGEHATFLGWLSGAELARVYASADVLVFPSATDTFGQVILEAQASGVAVLAVDEGGPRSLIESGRTGLLRPADAGALAAGLLEIAGSQELRTRLALGGALAVQERTWERALERLADAYARAMTDGRAHSARRVSPTQVRAA